MKFFQQFIISLCFFVGCMHASNTNLDGVGNPDWVGSLHREGRTGGDNPSWLSEPDANINPQVSRAKDLRTLADDLLIKNSSNSMLRQTLERLPKRDDISASNCHAVDEVKPLLFPGNTNIKERFAHVSQNGIPSLSEGWSYNPFSWGCQLGKSLYNVCSIPGIVCNNIWKEGKLAAIETGNSLYWSDSLWLFGGYVCADSIVRRTDNHLGALALSPLYVAMPLAGLWVKKCRVDTYRILHNNMKSLRTSNTDLRADVSSIQGDFNRVNIQSATLRRDNEVLESRNIGLERKVRAAELQAALQGEIKRREQRKRVKAEQKVNDLTIRQSIVNAAMAAAVSGGDSLQNHNQQLKVHKVEDDKLFMSGKSSIFSTTALPSKVRYPKVSMNVHRDNQVVTVVPQVSLPPYASAALFATAMRKVPQGLKMIK